MLSNVGSMFLHVSGTVSPFALKIVMLCVLVTNLREKLQAKFPQNKESSPPELSQAQEPHKGDDESLFEKVGLPSLHQSFVFYLIT